MTKQIALTAVLAALLANLAVTVTNRFLTGDAQAAATIHVVLEGGDRVALDNLKDDADQMLDLTQSMDRNFRQLVLLTTNSAPAQKAALTQEITMLNGILAALKRVRTPR